MQRRALHGCGGREAPFGLDGLGNVLGENRRVRCCFARYLVARSSSRRARERAMAWIRRRRKLTAAPFSSGGFWGPRAGVGIRGRTRRTFLRGWVHPTETKHPRVATELSLQQSVSFDMYKSSSQGIHPSLLTKVGVVVRIIQLHHVEPHRIQCECSRGRNGPSRAGAHLSSRPRCLRADVRATGFGRPTF
jgi:hypothetical protein